jgi:glyoxylase-like metal-dependent hydrolase (beta-lactamase superfamily II)
MAEAPLNVNAIDVGYLAFHGAGAAFAVSQGTGAGARVLVETGPAVCLRTLRAGLERAGIAHESIAHVLVTHVHLDHAGAAGHFAACGAHVWVHPRGARHLVDPAKLVAGTRAVHGSRFESEYGMPLPIADAQVHAVEDGERVHGALGAQAVATPGHARHHHAWVLRDARHAHVFTGDVAGILLPPGDRTAPESARGLSGDVSADRMRVAPARRFLAVPMPPSDMDVVAWRASIDRLEALVDSEERAGRAVTLWLTHGCAAADARAHLRELRTRLEEEHALCSSLCAEGLVPGCVPSAAAVERYSRWLWPRADAAGVHPDDRAVFLGAAFMRMNLAGVAQELSRGSAR